MKAYSLISCSSDYFCIGIYTSLENCYTALKSAIEDDLEFFEKSEIETFYEIKEIVLDNEPLECYEFSTYGKNIDIDWGKIFKGV
jgi:hypothetical protein